MKKKDIEKLRGSKIADLHKEAEKTRMAIAKAQMDATMGSLKDTNAVKKEKKKLAVILTVISEMETQG